MQSRDYEFLTGDTFYGDWLAVVINGAAVDLSTVWVVRAQVRDRSTGAKLFDLSTQLGTSQVTLDGVLTNVSTVRLHIPATASTTQGPFMGVYDVEVEHPTFDSGVTYRTTIAGGKIRSKQDVTRNG